MLTKRRASVLFLVMLLAFALVILLTPTQARASIATLYPTDDTFVRVGAPDTNFNGNADAISVTSGVGGTPSDIGYLRFDVSSISTEAIGSLTLRLYNRVSPGSSVTVAVYSTSSDDWNGVAAGNGGETTLTYNNAPAENSVLASATGSSSPAWMEFSSAALINYVNGKLTGNGGNGLVTFRIKVTSSGIADINSFEDRENGGGTGNMAQLVINQPTAVTVVSFTAQGYDNRVELKWITASEINTQGFYLRRRQAQEAQYARINPALIPGQIGSLIGGTYTYSDTRVAPGEAYYYQLEEVDIYGASTLHGPAMAKTGAPFLFYLPFVHAGGGP